MTRPVDCAPTCKNISLCEHGCVGYESDYEEDTEPDAWDLSREDHERREELSFWAHWTEE